MKNQVEGNEATKSTKNDAKFAARKEEILRHFLPCERMLLGALPNSTINKLYNGNPSVGHSGTALPFALESGKALNKVLQRNYVGLMDVTDGMASSLMFDATRFPEMAPENLKVLVPSEEFVRSLDVLVAKPILGLDLGDRELTEKIANRLFYFLEHHTDNDLNAADFTRSEIWACAYAISILNALEILKWRKTILSGAVSEELLSREAFRKMLPAIKEFKREILAA